MLSRSFLKSLSLTEDQISAIIEAHTDVTSGLIADRDRYKADAERLPALRQELDELKKSDFKSQFEAEKTAHDALKESVARKEAHAAREKAARTYYEQKHVPDHSIAIALRATDLDSLNLDDQGRLADTAALDELLAGDLKPLVTAERRTVSSGGSLSSRTEPQPSLNETMNRLLRGE